MEFTQYRCLNVVPVIIVYRNRRNHWLPAKLFIFPTAQRILFVNIGQFLLYKFNFRTITIIV